MAGPRVRFAPSPTGFFHVGSARTALFNWFVARQHRDGVFILRIEDTDEDRNREEWVEGILSAMAWLGLDLDEGPYRQSDNRERHAAAAWNSWSARATSTTATAPPTRWPRARATTRPPVTTGTVGTAASSAGPRPRCASSTPRDGVTVVHDLIRGDVEFANATIEDFVVAKSSGAVLYALANVTDDRHDRISHVIRGEEHLPTPPSR